MASYLLDHTVLEDRGLMDEAIMKIYMSLYKLVELRN